MSIIGPRTIQHGDDYKVFVTAIDYFDDAKIEISLTGNINEEEFESFILDLPSLNQQVLFNVRFLIA